MSNSTMEKAQAVNDYVLGLRHDFHANPEVSMEEVRTSGIVVKELEKMGIEVKRIGKTGVLGTLRGAAPGKVVALRADMDALSVTEQTGLPYSSTKPGVMHACGHDVHTSMLLGAAKILSGMKDQLKGTVKFVFQPAEEIAAGAKSMVSGGVLENPKVDLIFGEHVISDVEVGKVVVQGGFFMASGDTWKLTIKGVTSHGSTPWQGVDAITCAAAVIQGLQTIVSRVNDAREAIVINVGTIHGGDRFNITPGKVEMMGMNRAFSAKSRTSMPVWMEDMIKNICAAYRCEYEFKYDFICAPLTNDPWAAETVHKSIAKIVPEADIIKVPQAMGSEDFSEYTAVVPGMMMFVGDRNEAKDCKYSQHSEHYQVDEDCIPIGVASYVQVAADFLS
ncbi:MAG: amidohydrolase [Spirochaetaceae bacterium]|nr:amidohydrolase [Spirochaetaceae bacterium]